LQLIIFIILFGLLIITNTPKGQFNSAQGSALGKHDTHKIPPHARHRRACGGQFKTELFYPGRCPGLNYIRLSACGPILISIYYLLFFTMTVKKLYLCKT